MQYTQERFLDDGIHRELFRGQLDSTDNWVGDWPYSTFRTKAYSTVVSHDDIEFANSLFDGRLFYYAH